ncbi:MAG TPA: 1-deoxy-D-xylulose-5-phosphate synthase [Candidatus Coatesbacteria bacterium]|nr:1-deoxy-D-xylulose-5-phosphate synthase [Candidatus Coatesbacteria bacterium]
MDQSYRLLPRINDPAELRRLNLFELTELAGELRRYIIETVSRTGGHLAPSLGAVELAVALHYTLDTPSDKLVWDVGHQAYAHKVLTGRRDLLPTLRQYGGISGFPKPDESPYDAYAVGHASTAISAALGMALSREYKGQKHRVCAVVGDGSLTGGMAFEALNHAGRCKMPFLVVLNDNRMSISKSVGALSNYLNRMLTTRSFLSLRRQVQEIVKKIPGVGMGIFSLARKIEEGLKNMVTPGMLFEEMGFLYFGPIDGHDLPKLVGVLKTVRDLPQPVFLHVITTKGKGYEPAENDATKFHGLDRFDAATGLCQVSSPEPTYTEVFGCTLTELAARDRRVVGITAAMPDGTGLDILAAALPDQFIDVGIAEQHAVSLAGGLAISGQKPVLAIYSTFLQRAYDQMVTDICLMNLPVLFAVDRGGVVGADGPTHHGSFDLSYLRSAPNMTVCAAADEDELRHLLYTGYRHDGPFALRYPRGRGSGVDRAGPLRELPIGKGELLREGSEAVIAAIGSSVAPALEAAAALAEDGREVAVINARWLKPLDADLLAAWAERTGRLLTVEEGTLQGGFGSAVLEVLADRGLLDSGKIRVRRLGIPDRFVTHGTQEELRAELGLDAPGIRRAAEGLLAGE